LIAMKTRQISLRDIHFFLTPKRNIGDLKFKDDREVDTVVTWQLFEQDTK